MKTVHEHVPRLKDVKNAWCRERAPYLEDYGLPAWTIAKRQFDRFIDQIRADVQAADAAVDIDEHGAQGFFLKAFAHEDDAHHQHDENQRGPVQKDQGARPAHTARGGRFAKGVFGSAVHDPKVRSK